MIDIVLLSGLLKDFGLCMALIGIIFWLRDIDRRLEGHGIKKEKVK